MIRCCDQLKRRWETLSWNEASGALGDLGTFLPLTLGMAAYGVISLPAALFWAGTFNVITGFLWDSPMPVQPMKTIVS